MLGRVAGILDRQNNPVRLVQCNAALPFFFEGFPVRCVLLKFNFNPLNLLLQLRRFFQFIGGIYDRLDFVGIIQEGE